MDLDQVCSNYAPWANNGTAPWDTCLHRLIYHGKTFKNRLVLSVTHFVFCILAIIPSALHLVLRIWADILHVWSVPHLLLCVLSDVQIFSNLFFLFWLAFCPFYLFGIFFYVFWLTFLPIANNPLLVLPILATILWGAFGKFLAWHHNFTKHWLSAIK